MRVVLFAAEHSERDLIQRYVRRDGLTVVGVNTVGVALRLSHDADVLVVRVATRDDATLVHTAKQHTPGLPVLVLASDAELAIAAYGFGADIVALTPIDFSLLSCKVAVFAHRSPRSAREPAAAFDPSPVPDTSPAR